MKNKFKVITLLGLVLVACHHNNASSLNQNSSLETFNRSSLSIIAPTGAPALAFYNYGELNNFETNTDPSNITAIMSAGQKDVVVLPTNVGVKTITTAHAPYLIAATLTFGNFYVASLNNDQDNVMDANDNIVLFQKNNVPDRLFHYIYGNTLDDGIYYVNAVSDASRALKAGTFTDEETGNTLVANYVLIAEPAYSIVKSSKESVSIYANLQEEYRLRSNNHEIFQASLFVKNTLAKVTVDSFLSSLKKDIENVIANPSLLSEGMNKAHEPQTLFGVSATMAEAVLRNNNGMGLGYKAAKENKADIDTFLALFNIEETDEEIYY
ncbi:MAG TPA: hypothetical protein GX010_00435 [Erysipelotrichaceae bacterium]|nr:hypothetical protein [Erysipelotrichaceae bacterium]